MNKYHYIECVGLPGAGKSSAVDLFLKRNRHLFVSIRSPFFRDKSLYQKLSLSVVLGFRYGIRYVVLALYYLGARSIFSGHFFRGLVEYLAMRHRLQQAITQSGMVLYDQGVISSATLIWLEGGNTKARLKEFIYKMLPPYTVVVTFEVREEEAWRRYQEREKRNAYFAGLDESRILSTLASLQASYADSLSLLQTRPDIKVHTVTEAATVIEKSEALEDYLTPYFEGI